MKKGYHKKERNGREKQDIGQQDKEVTKVTTIDIKLTDEPLKNIILMAPHLEEREQLMVFGMICGLMGYSGRKEAAGQQKKEVI